MAFDWVAFLDQQRIEYKREGQRELRIRCPWCLTEGKVLAINVQGAGWHCWRNTDHRGHSPVRLVAALAGISLEEARRQTGWGGPSFDNSNNFAEQVSRLLLQPLLPPEEQIPDLTIPKEFRCFIDPSPLRQPFVRYLEERGITQLESLDRLNVRWVLSGRQQYRIVFLLYFRGRLAAWTGRTIVRWRQPRYLAEGHPQHYLLWFDQLMKGGDRIVLCEGPFDALRLQLLGQPATCFFTSGPSGAQSDLLQELLPRWERKVLLLDRGTLANAVRIRASLPRLGIEIATLPKGIKDPGELNDLDCLEALF